MKSLLLKLVVFGMVAGITANAQPKKELSGAELAKKLESAISDKTITDNQLVDLMESTKASERMQAINSNLLVHKAAEASVKGNSTVLKFLLRKGARVDVADANLNLPIHRALIVGKAESAKDADIIATIDLLEKYGANFSTRNKVGESSLVLSEAMSPEVAKAVKKFTGLLNAKDPATRRLEQLQLDLAGVESGNSDLRAVVRQLEADKAKLIDEKTTLIGEKTTLIGEKTRLIDEKTKLIDAKTTLESDKAKLIEEKTKLIDEKTALIGEKGKLIEEKTKLLQDKTALEGDKKKLTEERAKLTEEKSKLIEEKNTLQGQKTALEGDKQKLEAKVMQQEYQKAYLWLREQVITTCQAVEISRLKLKNKALDAKVAEKDAELLKAKETKDSLEAEIARLKECVQKLEDDKKTAEEKKLAADIKRIVATFKLKLERLCTGFRVRALEGENDKLKACVTDLQNKNMQLTDRNNQLLLQQVAALRSQIVQSGSSIYQMFASHGNAIVEGAKNLWNGLRIPIPYAHN